MAMAIIALGYATLLLSLVPLESPLALAETTVSEICVVILSVSFYTQLASSVWCTAPGDAAEFVGALPAFFWEVSLLAALLVYVDVYVYEALLECVSAGLAATGLLLLEYYADAFAAVTCFAWWFRPTTTNWAVDRATSLPEVWALVAENSDGIVDVWRLMRVCKAARAGAKEFLRTLPGLVVCGGRTSTGRIVKNVWRLNLATMRWEPMPALVTARADHACCAVRGALVVLGGSTTGGGGVTSSVEMLSSSEEGGAFVVLPPLSCGEIYDAAAVAVDESGSAAGKVLLLGGGSDDLPLSAPVAVAAAVERKVQLVDLATGACAPQNNLLHRRGYPAAGRLLDGRVVCVGGYNDSSAEVWGPPDQGAADAAWIWSELPAMSAERWGCCGCVMSDGRFAVLGGSSNGVRTSLCEALAFDDGGAHWEPLPPMHDTRHSFACGAVAGCVIVAGGRGRKSPELYDVELNRWLRLPCDLPYESFLSDTGSAVL
jgi:hypothetical protein